MRPAEVGRFVERTDTFHIFRCKCEIEYIQILFHSLDVRAFRDGGDAALHQVTQGDLLYRFIVSFGQSRQYGIGQKVGIALCQWGPSHDTCIIGLHFSFSIPLLTEYIGF